MTFKKLTEKQDKLVELIASFSGIAKKTFTASTGDGRMYSWSSDVHWSKGNYWLNIVVDDDGNANVLIHEGYAEDNEVYTALGYCQYHNIPYEIS